MARTSLFSPGSLVRSLVASSLARTNMVGGISKAYEKKLGMKVTEADCWRELLGPELTESLIRQAHREAKEERKRNAVQKANRAVPMPR